jgi:Uma2 family endonuclease
MPKISSSNREKQSPQKLLTEDDLWVLIAEGKNVSLKHGKLIDMSPASRNHGRVAHNVGLIIGSFVKKHKLGACYTAETGFVVERSPTTIMAPDFAFITKARDKPQEKGFGLIVPDFVLEVMSPSDSMSDAIEKTIEWLNAGVRLVWVADLKEKSVIACSKTGDEIKTLRFTKNTTINGGDVFKGLRCKVSEFFE